MSPNANDGNNTRQEPEHFPLDETAIEYIAQVDQQIRDLNTALNAVLGYFLRQHKLKGNWRLAPDRRELILDQPVSTQPQDRG